MFPTILVAMTDERRMPDETTASDVGWSGEVRLLPLAALSGTSGAIQVSPNVVAAAKTISANADRTTGKAPHVLLGRRVFKSPRIRSYRMRGQVKASGPTSSPRLRLGNAPGECRQDYRKERSRKGEADVRLIPVPVRECVAQETSCHPSSPGLVENTGRMPSVGLRAIACGTKTLSGLPAISPTRGEKTRGLLLPQSEHSGAAD
jgi:hypothetical protein